MKRLLPLLGLVLTAGACAWLQPASFRGFGEPGTPIGVIRPPRPPAPDSLRFSTASNREFARHDVQKLLRIVVLPEAAKQVADVPKSAPRWFREELSAHFDHAAIARRVWVVDEPLKQVVRFLRANARPRPRPEVPFRTPSNRIGSRPTENYLFHPVPGRSWSRWLNVAMLRLPGGATVVVAQAGDEWIRTPPRSAELPQGVKRIHIESRTGGPRSNVLLHVRDPYEVGSIVSWTNGLGVTPRNVICLAVYYPGPTVTLTFRAADGSVLARAEVRDPLGSGRSGPCDPLQLTVNGTKAPPLIGADLLLRIEQHLGVDLAPPVPSAVAGCLRDRGWKVQKVVHGGLIARRIPRPAELTASRDHRRWLITFHATGKVTTTPRASHALAQCIRSGPRLVYYG